MGTLVTFHAHPDDEAIATGGTMAKAVAAGHRVVLVTATGGELGEVADGYLGPGEALAERRAVELGEAARILGVARVELLGYRDSGMVGTPGNDDPGAFWQIPVEEAAARLADLLVEEGADVLTIYDPNGAYGHPDHIQVHRVGVRAAELASRRRGEALRVYESTINRDRMLRLIAQATEAGVAGAGELDDERFDMSTVGLPEAELTTAVDVSAHLDVKRAAMAAHASQINGESFFLAMPPDVFAAAFGTEWYRRLGTQPDGPTETDLFG